MMNTCNVWLHGSSRKGVIRWPKKCSHNETLLRVIKDALCIPIHIKIQVRALDKKVLDDNENSLLDSPTASTSLQTNSNDNNVISFIRIGEMGAIVSLGFKTIYNIIINLHYRYYYYYYQQRRY